MNMEVAIGLLATTATIFSISFLIIITIRISIQVTRPYIRLSDIDYDKLYNGMCSSLIIGFLVIILLLINILILGIKGNILITDILNIVSGFGLFIQVSYIFFPVMNVLEKNETENRNPIFKSIFWIIKKCYYEKLLLCHFHKEKRVPNIP